MPCSLPFRYRIISASARADAIRAERPIEAKADLTGLPWAYLIAVATELNVVVRFVPTVPRVVRMATEMSAAMRPYSMAVAPDSSRKKLMICDIVVP
jgi:hypothetical protein